MSLRGLEALPHLRDLAGRHASKSLKRRIVLLLTMPDQFCIRRAERERRYARRGINLAFPQPANDVSVMLGGRESEGRQTHKHIRHCSVFATVSYTNCMCCIPILRRGGVLGSSGRCCCCCSGDGGTTSGVVGCFCGAGSSVSCAVGVLSTPVFSRVSTTSGADAGAVGVGVRSILRRFGELLHSTFSVSSSSLSCCLRTDDLLVSGVEEDDDDDDDESGPGPGAGVGVHGRDSTFGASAGADAGDDADDGKAGGVPSRTTCGGGVEVAEATGDILDAAAPHVHLSVNCHAGLSTRARGGARDGRTCIISASFRSRCTRSLRSV